MEFSRLHLSMSQARSSSTDPRDKWERALLNETESVTSLSFLDDWFRRIDWSTSIPRSFKIRMMIFLRWDRSLNVGFTLIFNSRSVCLSWAFNCFNFFSQVSFTLCWSCNNVSRLSLCWSNVGLSLALFLSFVSDSFNLICSVIMSTNSFCAAMCLVFDSIKASVSLDFLQYASNKFSRYTSFELISLIPFWRRSDEYPKYSS